MAQHFLLSAKARTLSLAQVFRMSDDEAYQTFRNLRWPDGDQYCPHCGHEEYYEYRARRIFKCKACRRQFSVTSGTLFHSRKLAIRDYLAAIAIFVNGAKGISALQLSRDLDVQYRTAFVLAHKLREVMSAAQQGLRLSGAIEIDGCHFGGFVKQANVISERIDRRRTVNKTGKRQVVVAARQRGGRLLTNVYKRESGAVAFLKRRIEPGSTIYTDEAYSWKALHSAYRGFKINHTERYVDGPNGHITTNRVESYFSRLRRAEIGTHHRIAGRYLDSYADEMAWREDNRRKPNGTLYQLIAAAALTCPVSQQWKGYWQRLS